MGAIATTLESPEATKTALGAEGAGPQPRISVRRVRIAGLVVLGIQFFGLAVWSQILCSHFAVGTDFTGYGQAWFLMAHGHLDPYVSSWSEKFLSDHAAFIMIPLSVFWWVWPHAVTLLWLQCVAIVVGEGVAFVWMCEVADTLSSRRSPSARHQAGTRAVMVQQLWSWIDPAALLAVLGLVLLVADPWIYWTASFDVHFEVPAATFALLTAHDLAHLRTRAWLWAALTALSGDLGITYLFGVGISAVLAGQAWRKKGIILLVAPVAAFGLVDTLGLTTGSSVIGKYLTGRPQTGSSNLGGWSKLGHDMVAHPRAYVSRLRNHLINVYGTIAPAGAIGLFCAWGFGVPLVVLVENAFANRVDFSDTAFQNYPVYLFVAVGTVMVLAGLVLRWPRTSALLASVILLSTVGWAVTWGSKTASTWLRVSHPAAVVLNRTLARLPPGAEVLASHSVIGPFAERANLYEFNSETEPLVTRSVWFIVAPSQGINTESVQSDLARLSWLAGPLGAKLVDHGGGVWVFKLATPPGATTADFLDGCPTIPAWAEPGAAGRSDVRGDSAGWTAVANGAQGYVVAGDYWRLGVGSYEAAVALRSAGPVSVEVWDADRSQLVARRQLPSTDGSTLVTLPFEAPKEVPPAGSEGFGPFRMTFPPPPAHDQLEVRVYTPGHSAIAVSSVTVVPSSLASSIGSIATTVC